MIFIVMMVILISRAMITWSSMRMFLKRGKLLHHLTSLYNLDKYKKLCTNLHKTWTNMKKKLDKYEKTCTTSGRPSSSMSARCPRLCLLVRMRGWIWLLAIADSRSEDNWFEKNYAEDEEEHLMVRMRILFWPSVKWWLYITWWS